MLKQFQQDKVWKVSKKVYDDIIHQLLYNRGVIGLAPDTEVIKSFLSPDFISGTHDPFLLIGLKEATERIKQAIYKNETVGIFGDYDADGVPASALLHRTFKALGLKSIVYIPTRDQGYGLSKSGIDYLIKQGCGLVITVDLGIRSLAEAEYCKEKRIDLIITDHHLPGELLPNATIVINPKQASDKYPNKELSGAGVAFKLMQGLGVLYPKKVTEQFLKWNLDLVAISTISDVVKLVGENRVFAKFGLVVLNKTRNIGLASLIKRSGIKTPITGYSVGFQIAPRINAPGRIDHATKSFELLVTDDPIESETLSDELNERNEARQHLMDKAEKEIINQIISLGPTEDRLIVVAGKWERGIVGPTASRLVDHFSRPVIVFSEDGEELVGSARSVEGVNIITLFESAVSCIKKFGGHAGAAGLTVEKKLFPKFVQAMKIISDEQIPLKSLRKVLKIDAEVSLRELTVELSDELSKFEPYGIGNSRPKFLVRNVNLSSPRFVGREKNHLSAMIGDGDCSTKMIFFNSNLDPSLLSDDVKIDLVCSLGADEWNGKRKACLTIEDIRMSDET